MHIADTDIRYALFRDLGRTNILPLNTTTNLIGRYPIHMHHNRGPLPTPANGYQFTLIGNAVDGGSIETQFKWGIAIHNSHYGLIQDNVVYNYNGSAIATEDGSESYNVFDHNFAMRGMGEPNNSVERSADAMGTEGVGFWFRGPNNYVTNNVAANFQNPTVEAAYGFVYQFIRLGNISIPTFKGADPAVAGQFTTKNGNACRSCSSRTMKRTGPCRAGSLTGGSAHRIQPLRGRATERHQESQALARLQQGIYHYPAQKVIFDGLIIRGNYARKPMLRRWLSVRGLFSEGHRHSKFRHSRNGAGYQGPSSGFGPGPNLLIENSYLRNWNNIGVPTPSSVNGCWMENKLVTLEYAPRSASWQKARCDCDDRPSQRNGVPEQIGRGKVYSYNDGTLRQLPGLPQQLRRFAEAAGLLHADDSRGYHRSSLSDRTGANRRASARFRADQPAPRDSVDERSD